ncbi:MAG: dihydropteroate synthase [Candidatus Omnitrophota bacterium]|nr:dihydropteroate synthase [Candidatus Omnitrophota bacterium]MBU1894218.1 dihydropteroate synthase [Candidatus Omnitrophota bacterium]
MKIKDCVLPIGERTCIMGILNVTSDSFSGDGIYLNPSEAAVRAQEMVTLGADIIDIGGESSRPGAVKISETEELDRVIPVIRAVRNAVNIAISIDTYKSEVARQALMEGAVIVNDITSLRHDSCMAKTIAEFSAGVILMHMKGTPETMQKSPVYGDLINEIYLYLKESVVLAEKAGIDPAKIIIDPGIGFGKTVQHNVLILRELKRFRDLNKPVLVGTSRKSFIGELTSRKINEREFGTAATCAVAIINGADIIRVHNVSAMRDVVVITDKLVR